MARDYVCETCGAPAVEVFECAYQDVTTCRACWTTTARSLLIHGVRVEAIYPVQRICGHAVLGSKLKR